MTHRASMLSCLVVLLCLLAPFASATIQFSFCIISSSTSSPTYSSTTALASGIFNTSSTTFSATGTYTVTSIINGTWTSVFSGTSYGMTLQAPGGLGGNDNIFTISTSSNVGTTDIDGISYYVSGTTYEVNIYEGLAEDTTPSAASYATLYVQQYTPSAPSMIACARPAAPSYTQPTILFSFCVISSSTTTPQYSTTTALATGIFNTSSTTFTNTGTYTVTQIVNGTWTSVSGTSYGVTLQGPGGYGGNDNLFTISTSSNVGTTDGDGISYYVSGTTYEVNIYEGYALDTTPSSATYATLYVQYYNRSAPSMISCARPAAPVSTGAPVMFSFCMVTASSQTLTSANWVAYATGIINTTTPYYAATSSYVVNNIINGQWFYNDGNGNAGTTLSLSLLTLNTYFNDNIFSTTAGSTLATTDFDGVGFLLSSGVEIDLWYNTYIDCSDGTSCGAVALLYVQRYNSTTTSNATCGLPAGLAPLTAGVTKTFSFCGISWTSSIISEVSGENVWSSLINGTMTVNSTGVGQNYRIVSISGQRFVASADGYGTVVSTTPISVTSGGILYSGATFLYEPSSLVFSLGTSQTDNLGCSSSSVSVSYASATGTTYTCGGTAYANSANTFQLAVYNATTAPLTCNIPTISIPSYTCGIGPYNFSSLASGPDLSYYSAATGYTIFGRLCGTVNQSDCTHSFGRNIQFCQWSSPTNLYELASAHAPTGEDTFAYANGLDASSGITFVIQDGTYCAGLYPRKVTGTITCGAQNAITSYAETVTCQYALGMTSPLACPINTQVVGAPVQFSFCMITSTTANAPTYNTWSTYTYGIFNTTSVITSTNYSVIGNTYLVNNIINGYINTTTDGISYVSQQAISLIPVVPGWEGNDNTIAISGTSTSLIPTLSEGGLSYQVNSNLQYNIYAGNSLINTNNLNGLYNQLMVAQYTASTGTIQCPVPTLPPVAFSFCAFISTQSIVSTATWKVAFSGILQTSTPGAAYAATGTYTVTSILNGAAQFADANGNIITAQNSNLTLSAVGQLGGNDNSLLTTSGSTLGGTDVAGITWQTSASNQYNFYENSYLECSSTCPGTYASITIARYTSGNQLQCTPPTPPIQFSFCLTLSSTPTPTSSTWHSIASGIMTLSPSGFIYRVVNMSAASINYSYPDESGRSHYSTNISVLAQSLYNNNDNYITITGNTATFTSAGLGFVDNGAVVSGTMYPAITYALFSSGSSQYALCNNCGYSGVVYNGVTYWPYATMTVQAYNSTTAPLTCAAPAAPVATTTGSSYAFTAASGAVAYATAPAVVGNASGTENGVANNNDGCSQVSIGFTFTFYGTQYTSAQLCSNGNIQFSSTPDYSATPTNTPASTLFNTIFFFWSDLYPNVPTSQKLYWTQGVAPYRQFFYRFYGVGYCCSATVSTSQPGVTADVVLYESWNKVEVRYYTVNSGSTYSVMIGMVGRSLSDKSIVYNTSVITASTALGLSGATYEWVPVNTSASAVVSSYAPTTVTWGAQLTAPFPAQYDGACANQPLNAPLASGQTEPYMFLLGGGAGATYFDVWQTSNGGSTTAGWTQLISAANTAIPVLSQPVAAYLANGLQLVFSGYSYNTAGYVNTVWYTTNSWQTYNTYAAPWSQRETACATSIPDTTLVLMCNGWSEYATATNQCWLGNHTMSGTSLIQSWTQQSSASNSASPNTATTTTPGAVGFAPFPDQFIGSSLVSLYDSTNTVLLMGGKDELNIWYYAYTWVSYDLGQSWTSPIAAPWLGRALAQATVDLENIVYIVGGEFSHNTLTTIDNDIWATRDKGLTWAAITAAGSNTLTAEYAGCVGIRYLNSIDASGNYQQSKMIVVYSGLGVSAYVGVSQAIISPNVTSRPVSSSTGLAAVISSSASHGSSSASSSSSSASPSLSQSSSGSSSTMAAATHSSSSTAATVATAPSSAPSSSSVGVTPANSVTSSSAIYNMGCHASTNGVYIVTLTLSQTIAQLAIQYPNQAFGPFITAVFAEVLNVTVGCAGLSDSTGANGDAATPYTNVKVTTSSTTNQQTINSALSNPSSAIYQSAIPFATQQCGSGTVMIGACGQPTSSGGSGLSTGAIVGIAIGCAVGVCLLCLLVLLCLYRRSGAKPRAQTVTQPEISSIEPGMAYVKQSVNTNNHGPNDVEMAQYETDTQEQSQQQQHGEFHDETDETTTEL